MAPTTRPDRFCPGSPLPPKSGAAGPNHPIVDAVDPDVDSDVERLWGLPRGTLRAVHRGAPWPMPTLAADRVARPPAPPPAARLPAPPSAAAIVGDSLAARKVAGGQALHRPRLFLNRAPPATQRGVSL